MKKYLQPDEKITFCRVLRYCRIQANYFCHIANSHGKLFKMRYTRCLYNNLIQSYSSKCWKIAFHGFRFLLKFATHFTTISGHLFANYVKIFHKTEDPKVILRYLFPTHVVGFMLISDFGIASMLNHTINLNLYTKGLAA